jgi:hypothetical protein
VEKNSDHIPLNVVNTGIDWQTKVQLQNGLALEITNENSTRATLHGNGFTCVVTKSTGLPISDVFNWDLFPVKNTI